MKKAVKFVFILFLCTQLSFAQNNEEDILKDPEFIELKKEAISYFTSDEYLKRQKTFGEFIAKMPEDFSFEDNFESWVKERINDTQFNSVEEAIAAKEYLDHLSEESDKKVLPIHRKRNLLNKKYGLRVFEKIYSEEVDHVIIMTLLDKSKKE